MRKKITILFFLVFLFSVFAREAHAQFFEVDTEQIQPQTGKQDLYHNPDDPFNDPEKVKEWFERFHRGEGKIVGGEDVDIEDYPWQVSLQLTPAFGGGHFCGGIIIDAEWILTASHCLIWDEFDLTPNHVRVRAGFTAQNQPQQGNFYGVAEVIVHPGYDPDANVPRFDIALLRLATPLNLAHPGKRPVGLVTQADAAQGLTDPGTMVKVSGWGALSSGGPSPNILQAIEVPIVDVSNTSYSPGTISADMIIAGAPGQDACQGDSGGPMVVPDGNGWYKAAGVVSFGVGCGAPGYPGVYARVSFFEDWLAEYLVFTDPNQFSLWHHEQFDGGDIPQGWANEVVSGPPNFPGWEWTTQGADYGGQLNSTTASNGYLMVDSDGHGSAGNTEEAHLITEAYDMSELAGNTIFMSVEHLARTFGAAEVSIYVSADDFASQTQLYHWAGAPQHQTNGPNPVVSVFDITDVAQGQSNVKFKFKWVGNWDYWWLVDDLRILVENPQLEVQFNVTDGQQPIEGALVTTGYVEQDALTNEDGVAFLPLYEGDYTIEVIKAGYFPFETNITVTEDGQIIDIDLEKIPAPEILVSVDHIDVTVQVETSMISTFSISNTGDADLTYALFAYPVDSKGSAAGSNGKTAWYEGFDNMNPSVLDAEKGATHQSTESGSLNGNSEKYEEFVEIHHDDQTAASGVGAGANTWITAARFDVDDMAPYLGLYQIAQIKYHIRQATFTNVTVKIWEGGSDDGPGLEIYSQDVTDDVIANAWNIHELSENIDILAGAEYWFGYQITSTGQFPSSVDQGPVVEGKGAWIFFNGGWSELTELNADLNFNWNIRGVLQIQEQVEWLAIEPQEGTIGPESGVDVQLTFDPGTMEPGEYHAQLVIQNNAGPAINIPVSMTVIAIYDVVFDVVDPAGVAVEDAVVTLGALTNESGDYLFADVEAGNYEYSVSKEGYLDAQGTITVNQEMTVSVILIPDDQDVVDLTIEISDDLGEPIENAWFFLQGFGEHYTNADGEVQLTVVPGSFDYVVTKTGFDHLEGTAVIGDDAVQTLDIELTWLRFDVTLSMEPDNAGELSGEGEYIYGQTVTIDALANEGFHFIQWEENGEMVTFETTYEFEVFENRHFNAVFAGNVYTILATSGPNGTIDPEGEIDVAHGDDVTFTIAPDTGFAISDVQVDGESVGAVNSYTFENVTQSATIHAEFEQLTYEVTITSEGNGTIAPSGVEIVPHGGSITFELTPDAQHHVEDLLINGNSVGAPETYLLSNITQNTTVHAVFAFSVGVDELISEQGIKVYPNPASHSVTVESSEMITEIRLFNLAGQLVRHQVLEAETQQLNVEGLQAGIYMLQVTTTSGINTYRLNIR